MHIIILYWSKENTLAHHIACKQENGQDTPTNRNNNTKTLTTREYIGTNTANVCGCIEKHIVDYVKQSTQLRYDMYRISHLRPSWFKTARMVAELRRLTLVSWSSGEVLTQV